jgi:hypothetical protein
VTDNGRIELLFTEPHDEGKTVIFYSVEDDFGQIGSARVEVVIGD